MYSIDTQNSEKYFRNISVSLEFGVIHTHNVGFSNDGESLVNKYEDGELEEDTLKYPFNFKG